MDTKTRPRIVGVAMKSPDGEVRSLSAPNRHHNLISAANRSGLDVFDWEQGFVDANGRFLTRFQAGQVARRCRQIDKLRWPPDLYSEDLW